MTTLTSEQTQTKRRWIVDPARSTVEFSVRHFWGRSTVWGRFDRFNGSYVGDPEHQQIELTAEATTTVDQRQLGMTCSPLASVRAPAAVHVRARLT